MRIPFSRLKSLAIIFPILTGALLTTWGAAKLGQANLVPAERWNAPHGLLVFGSVPLTHIYVHVGAGVSNSRVEGETVPAEVDLNFGWDWGHPEYPIPEEVTVGVQFPHGVVNHRNFDILRKDGEQTQTLPTTEKKVIVMEDQGAYSSIFYVTFTPPHVHDWQHYGISINFDWDGAIHRESYSVFTISLPIVLDLEPEWLEYPYEQCPEAHYTYHGSSVELTVGIEFPWDFEIKQSYPPTGIVMTEMGGDARNMFWEPQIHASGKRISGKLLQMIMVEFEVTRLSERRDRLLFDSGIYMGLGVGLVITGIHEALKANTEPKKTQAPNLTPPPGHTP